MFQLRSLVARKNKTSTLVISEPHFSQRRTMGGWSQRPKQSFDGDGGRARVDDGFFFFDLTIPCSG